MKSSKVHAASAIAVAIVLGLMVGCAGDPSRSEPEPATRVEPMSPPAMAEPVAEQADASVRLEPRREDAPALAESTGIVACDDYLASYLSCHRVIGTYDAANLEDRYEKLRLSLLEESRDPELVPELQTRCTNLAGLMKDALKGRACADQAGFEEPVPDVDPEK